MSDSRARRDAKGLSVIDGVAVMVGIVLGIGIFKTPSLVAANVGGEVEFIAVWLVGGLITLCGALCYAELAVTHPSSGGEYHFLSRAYGPRLAVLFAWARGTVIQTGAIAAVAFVYGDYAQSLLPLGPYGLAIHAAIIIVAITALNMWGTRHSSLGQRGFTLLTLVAVAVVIAAGFLSFGAALPEPESTARPADSALGMAMVFVLLTYGGWSEAVYLSGEMRDVQRSMKLTLIFGTGVVVLVYGAFNLALLNAFGLDGLRATATPATDLMGGLGGGMGEVLLSVVVCIMAISTLNGTVITGARAFHALGRDLPMLGFLARSNLAPDGAPPLAALAVQGAIALALVLFGALTRDGFQAMVDFTAPVFWSFLLLVSLSLFLFRWREPNYPRPFRVPFYPVVPALFSLACAGLLYASLAYTGLGALVGVGIVLAGLPLLAFVRTPAEAGLAPGAAE